MNSKVKREDSLRCYSLGMWAGKREKCTGTGSVVSRT